MARCRSPSVENLHEAVIVSLRLIDVRIFVSSRPLVRPSRWPYVDKYTAPLARLLVNFFSFKEYFAIHSPWPERLRRSLWQKMNLFVTSQALFSGALQKKNFPDKKLFFFPVDFWNGYNAERKRPRDRGLGALSFLEPRDFHLCVELLDCF